MGVFTPKSLDQDPNQDLNLCLFDQLGVGFIRYNLGNAPQTWLTCFAHVFTAEFGSLSMRCFAWSVNAAVNVVFFGVRLDFHMHLLSHLNIAPLCIFFVCACFPAEF